VSESGVHSDSYGLFTGDRVRIRVSFGQLWSIHWGSCPNQGFIRTALVYSRGIVSESGVYSDSFGLFKGDRVRIRVSFGQLWSIQGGSCPNQGLIRTTLVYSRGILSESEAHSDNFSPFKGDRVRIRVSFGQLWSIQGGSCPNQRLIRTTLVHSRGIVFESGSHSDSYGLF
jgi:hypothetical protein